MVLLLLGAAVVALVMLDLIWSTLTTLGGGPVTSRLTTGIRNTMSTLYWHRRNGSLLTLAGPLAIIAASLFWLLGLWLGWTLIFSGLADGVVDANTGNPADLSRRIYYVGFTLSTLGVGDLKPSGDAARVLTDIAAFNGLILTTLAITYAVPLVSGAVQKRQLAYSIANLGYSPLDLVRSSWNGKDFQALESTLGTVAASLFQNAEQRLAYPILDNYHSRERGGALGLQLVVLDEALSLMMFGLDGPQRPDPVMLKHTRGAVRHYLDRVARDMGPVTADVPEPPDLAALADSGLTLVSADEFAARIDAIAERRRLLHELLRRHGWDWSDVTATQPRGDQYAGSA